MLSKSDLRDTIINEYKIIKQLVSKLPEDAADYRISPNQRSTLELSRYLCLLGPGLIHAGIDNGFAWFGENNPKLESLTLAEVPGYLEGAINEMESLFEKMTDEDFASREVRVEGMGEWTMQSWLLNTACRFIPSYKLMLFHHAKAAGNSDIDTWDAWMDNGTMPRPVPQEAWSAHMRPARLAGPVTTPRASSARLRAQVVLCIEQAIPAPTA